MVGTHKIYDGVFKANVFINCIRDNDPRLRICWVNTHYQNGVAECAIKIGTNIAKAMMLFASVHWLHVETGQTEAGLSCRHCHS